MPTFDPTTRGRIVLLNRFDVRFPFGYCVKFLDNNWNDGEYSSQHYHIQDKYQIDSACDNKVDQVNGFMGRALAGEGADLFLNFSSGVNAPEPLHSSASKINPRVENYVKGKTGRLGVVVMDFPPHTLIDVLISSNKKLFK
jgi:hypothetical protein